MTWEPEDPAAVLRRTDDPFLRYAVAPDSLAVAGPLGWACLLRWRPGGHWGGAAVVPPDAPEDAETQALAALTDLAGERGVRPQWFSTAGERPLHAPAGLRFRGSGLWDFRWTTSAAGLPPAPAGTVELDDARDAREIEDFGLGHNPDFEGFPGRGLATLWLAVRDDAGLAAVGALHELGSGAPHLAGIVVRPDRRRHGLGAALTAELTRRAVARHGVATLGVYSANLPALRVYDRLGYATAHRFLTRNLVPEEEPEPAREPASAAAHLR